MHSRQLFFLNFFIFLFFLSTSSYAYSDISFEKMDVVFASSQLQGKKVSVSLEVAVTEEQKTRGFMNRKIIPEGTGMIFLYSVDERLCFWMKDTPTPLSIAFISSSGEIKEIKDLNAYSLERVCSSMSVRYALEVPRGMFERLRLGVGDRMTKETLLMLKRFLASKK